MEKDILKPIDLSKKLKRYENKWVALSLDNKKILGAGDALKEAKEKAERKNKDYILIKLPSFKVSYIPFS
ncbi:MAG: DUF5678 domain-containing protein [candidate division WOR-3 bacterium]